MWWVAAGDATLLPVANETVDVVIASEILEHIPNYLSVLEEDARVEARWRLRVSVPQWPEWICWKSARNTVHPWRPHSYFRFHHLLKFSNRVFAMLIEAVRTRCMRPTGG